jgi:NADPH2:quinone reductase
MHAIEITQHGGADVLSYVDSPRPSPGPGEVLIKAEAIGVNFVDTYFRTGLYPHALPFVPGAEVCGTVAAVGDTVTHPRVGERVASADATGAYAEFSIAPADLVAQVPDTVTPETAAAALLKGLTAHLLINSVYAVDGGDTILLHAGAGGVGLILTQWATARGARVITTVSTPRKADLSRRAGAATVLDYPDDPGQFGTTIRSTTPHKPSVTSRTGRPMAQRSLSPDARRSSSPVSARPKRAAVLRSHQTR